MPRKEYTFTTCVLGFSLRLVQLYRWQDGMYAILLGAICKSQLECFQQDINHGPQACTLKNILLSSVPTKVNTKNIYFKNRNSFATATAVTCLGNNCKEGENYGNDNGIIKCFIFIKNVSFANNLGQKESQKDSSRSNVFTHIHNWLQTEQTILGGDA